MIHPIEGRYGRPEMKSIWEESSKWSKCLMVEAALAKAQADLGIIPKKDAVDIEEKADLKHVSIERIKEIEKETNHDIASMVRALSEQCKSGYVHFGATSNDITDSALALQFKGSLEVIENDLKTLKKTFVNIAKKTRSLVCIGRTHGQQAIPTTYGLRFAVWAVEVERHLERLSELKKRVLVGQMSGAVGTQAAMGPKAIEIQEKCMGYLGLSPVLVSTQVIQRDRHAELLQFLSLVAESLNKFGINLRSWQRTEIGEVSERFEKGQVGSSTMSHKTNPIHLERVCGLSRIVTGNSFAGLRNVALWDERDLTNSSPERILFPESFILLDYILSLMIKALKGLEFNKENIERNLALSKGLVLAERVMIELAKKGMDRQDAHELLRKVSMRAKKEGIGLKEALSSESSVGKQFSPKELDMLMDPHTYIGTAVKQVDRVIAQLK